MDTAFEYISAGIILSMILGVTGMVSRNMVSDRMNQIEGSANFKIADKMIDSLLLSPGSPGNWGTSLDSPQGIGLALEGGVKLYQLDRNKVKRLLSSSAGYIPPYEVRNLLGLSPNYFVKLEIEPMYQITVEPQAADVFRITVLNKWGVPVSSANVTGAYTSIVNVNATEIASFINGGLDGVYRSNTTNVSGQCTLNFTGETGKVTLLVLASQLSVKSAAIWPSPSPDLIGDLEASMGASSSFDVEIASRSVEIDGMNYNCKMTLWWN